MSNHSTISTDRRCDKSGGTGPNRSKFYYDSCALELYKHLLESTTQGTEKFNNTLEQFINNLDIRIGRLLLCENTRSKSRSG
jgi:hypothetical protein